MPGYFLQVLPVPLPPSGPPSPHQTWQNMVAGGLAIAVAILGSMAWVNWQEQRVARRNRRAQERVLPFSPKVTSELLGVLVNEASHATLVATRVSYRSQNDERSFVEWLHRIEGVDRVQSVDGDVRMHVRLDIDEPALRDLVALFFRYGVDLAQIPKVFSVDAHAWLRDESGYWFEAMFPEGVT